VWGEEEDDEEGGEGDPYPMGEAGEVGLGGVRILRVATLRLHRWVWIRFLRVVIVYLMV
jgi:hypothetical protein